MITAFPCRGSCAGCNFLMSAGDTPATTAAGGIRLPIIDERITDRPALFYDAPLPL